ncbi:hypothetical protein GLIP_0564 [Aliiglaciecola lipolytica E3]|uniref:Calcineurin-like phosphoesterase domain-containing protein n=1 Tax=Aliiglaciecola lipolytica E3 TaxID=1127673 RepID=K6YPE6_9ALTE|nr:hypothetical protein GLIP_0564 [Aliiglaciecola lipolytica E3]
MKILHCTDLHDSDDAITWINENSESFDVICLTSDFLDHRETQFQQKNKLAFIKNGLMNSISLF